MDAIEYHSFFKLTAFYEVHNVLSIFKFIYPGSHRLQKSESCAILFGMNPSCSRLYRSFPTDQFEIPSRVKIDVRLWALGELKPALGGDYSLESGMQTVRKIEALALRKSLNLRDYLAAMKIMVAEVKKRFIDKRIRVLTELLPIVLDRLEPGCARARPYIPKLP